MSSDGSLLIVEDNPAMTAVVKGYLSGLRDWAEVLTAPDADHGLRLAAERHPTAIVLDNRMPGTAGIDVLGDLRRACPDARIVMHTTEDTIDLREEAERRGADAIVGKGQPLADLAAALGVA